MSIDFVRSHKSFHRLELVVVLSRKWRYFVSPKTL